ncbi:MAG: hypothetical protein GTN99_03380, partial [Candidatus Dadabacteria bacterium]|nr:hypothetical protein [Candidatus Dadabacteria bacterium]
TFGAQVELEYRLFRNLKNDGDADGDFSVMEPGLTLAFSFDPSDHVQAFVESKIARIISFDLDDTSEDQMTLEIEQGYLLFKNLYESGLSVQIGRQKFEDEREWLYEEELDAVRLKYDISYYSLDFSVSRLNLVDRDLLNSDEKEKIYNYGFYGKYQTETDDSETILGAFILYRDDRTQDNESPVFLGLHAS